MNFEREKNQEIIQKYQDLRGLDMSSLDLSGIPVQVLNSTNFNTKTVWPSKERLPTGFNPEIILKNSKNSGLGIEQLHNEGINGSGVAVAIIDQKLLIGHTEYRNSISQYDEIGEQNYGPQMHGAAVASLLVGNECGVAPEAHLFYEAVPCGRNFHYFSMALEKIINHNSSTKEKIRVVSCSVGYNKEQQEKGLKEWIKMLKQAEKENIIVMHCSMQALDVLGCGNLDNKDDIEGFNDWLNSKDEQVQNTALRVPIDYRTYASYNGNNEYEYSAKGGLSWAMPYLTGIVCLMLQINPKLKNKEVFQYIRNGFKINKKGLRIINPRLIINSVIKNLPE